MKVLIATDAWRPQVNGVVRTLAALARAAQKLGVEIEFLSPEGFWSFPVPTYPGLRLALPTQRQITKRIEATKPDAIHLSPPKARSGTRCAPTASNGDALSPRAIRPGFPNISLRACQSRSNGSMGRCGASMPGQQY